MKDLSFHKKFNRLIFSEKLEAYNARSLVWEDEERVVYLFDYSKSSGRSEIINRHVLKKLVCFLVLHWFEKPFKNFKYLKCNKQLFNNNNFTIIFEVNMKLK